VKKDKQYQSENPQLAEACLDDQAAIKCSASVLEEPSSRPASAISCSLLNPGCSHHHVRRGGVRRELGGEQAVVGGGGEQQQGGVQQLGHPKQQARQAGPAIPSHPPVPRPDCSTHPAAGPCQFGKGTTTGPNRVFGRLPAQA